MKIKMFKIKKNFRKGGFFINPITGWKIILCVIFLLILASFAFGFYLFTEASKEFIPSAEVPGKIKIVDKERVEEVLEIFSAREEKSKEILNSPASVVDPSL